MIWSSDHFLWKKHKSLGCTGFLILRQIELRNCPGSVAWPKLCGFGFLVSFNGLVQGVSFTGNSMVFCHQIGWGFLFFFSLKPKINDSCWKKHTISDQSEMATSVLDVLPSLNGHRTREWKGRWSNWCNFCPESNFKHLQSIAFFFAYKVVSQLITIFEKHGWGSVSICF